VVAFPVDHSADHLMAVPLSSSAVFLVLASKSPVTWVQMEFHSPTVYAPMVAGIQAAFPLAVVHPVSMVLMVSTPAVASNDFVLVVAAAALVTRSMVELF